MIDRILSDPTVSSVNVGRSAVPGHVFFCNVRFRTDRRTIQTHGDGPLIAIRRAAERMGHAPVVEDRPVLPGFVR